MGKRKLKYFLLNPHFQLLFVGFNVFALVAILAALYLTNMYLVHQSELAGQSWGLPPSHPYFVFLRDHQRILNIVFLVTGIVAFLFLFVGGIIWSHRVAGPLYRLREHLRMINEGKTVNKLNFRKGDFFTELVDPFNEAFEKARRHSEES